MKTKELITKIMFDMRKDDTRSFLWMKDKLLRDIMEIESELDSFRRLWGIDMELTFKPIEAPKGRWFGKGIADEIDNLTK